MGNVEYNNYQLIVYSHLITYGEAATEEITEQMREEIETMWNEPNAVLKLNGLKLKVVFKITAKFQPDISATEIYQNLDPANNYFRIEEFAHGNISFVDGLGCNSGYFKTENLYKGSTTAAHEYGHTLGLDHPKKLDIRGKGVPGIMYPRGTLVDPQYQYDPSKPAGVTGGTMHPIYRKVKKEDIESLNFYKLTFNNNKAIIGEFTSIYHWNHAEISPEKFMRPPIYG
jgi:hypothetical protein